MPSSYAFCRPFSCFDISLNLQRCKGGEQRPRPCLLSPTTPHTRQQKHRAERRRRRHPMLSLSCTSNKAIEAGPLAPPTIVGRLPRGWGMSPSYPFIPPLDLCVFVCRKFRFMRETNRTLLCEAGICMWVLCVRVRLRGVCADIRCWPCRCVRFDFATSHYPHSCTHALSMALSPNNSSNNTRSRHKHSRRNLHFTSCIRTDMRV